MSEEVLLVDDDLPTLSRSVRNTRENYDARQPGDPLANAGRGMPQTHAASMCQTIAGLLDAEWDELATSLENFADAIDEAQNSMIARDSDIASAFSSIAERVKPIQGAPAARSNIPLMG